MSKLKDSDIYKQIYNYLVEQNRPFSANDIFNNVLQDCGKTAKTRALELMVSEEKIKEKTYGKQKVYYVNQNVFSDSKNDDLQSMDAKITELSSSLNVLQKQIKNSEVVLEDLNKTLPTEIAKGKLHASKNEVLILEDKLKTMESKCARVDAKEKGKLCENKEKYAKAYHRRKRIATNVIDAILEGYPKSKKQLLEELGVELDDKKL